MFYTIGQRQGLGIGGVRNYPENPWYVIDKDIKNNILIVAQGNEHTDLYSTRLIASQLFGLMRNNQSCLYIAQRKLDTDKPINYVRKGLDSGFIQVDFDKPQEDYSGQHVVFYTGEQCLGGAIIEHASQNYSRRQGQKLALWHQLERMRWLQQIYNVRFKNTVSNIH